MFIGYKALIKRAPEEQMNKVMADTYSQIYIHIVFAVKGRDSLFPKDGKKNYINILRGLLQMKVRN